MRTLTEIRNEKMSKEAKELAKTFLSMGRSMRDLEDYAKILIKEAEFQVTNNTIGGLSNGHVV